MELAGAAEIADAVGRTEVSPTEVLEAALDTVRRHEPTVNAFTEVLEESARAEARAVARAHARENLPGPLAGAPVAIKDVIWSAGVPATKGSRALRDFVPEVDAAAVERLRRAGAVILGRTNTSELCFRGITDNAVFGRTSKPSVPSASGTAP